MRIHENQIYAFALGAAVSWLITYLHLTHDERLCKRIRKMMDYIGSYYSLPSITTKELRSSLTDKRLLETYLWAKGYSKNLRAGKPPIKLDPETVTAQTLICEEALGLTRAHGLRALMRTKFLDDLVENLQNVVADLENDDRFPIDRKRWDRFASLVPVKESPPEARVPMVPR